jgi:PAS domain S-box-containing protein
MHSKERQVKDPSYSNKVYLEQMKRCLDQSYEGILLSDLEQRIFYANESVERISGLSNSEIVGETPKELEKKGVVISQSIKILKKNPVTISQKLKTGKDVFITSQPVCDKNGKTICYIANYRDLKDLNELHHEHHSKIQIDYSELQELRSRFLETDEWISHNDQMQLVREKIFKVAQTEACVLISGESGVGKGVVAKIIHKLSTRSEESYIQINCGAIPDALIESELFGYEKGAFTGAGQTKAGLLEVANKGTVLLDEIGELPLHLQVKLLQVIQTKEITRVGGTESKKLDIRFVVATNRYLKKMVDEGTFREDLYYRLNVIPIQIPPLRERTEDIIPLACYFLDKFNRKYKTKKYFQTTTCQLLQRYHWPGNVRQLENMIERMVIMANGEMLDQNSLPTEIMEFESGRHSFKHIIPLKKLKEATEREMISLALSKYKSIRKASKHLDVDHSTLVRKMQKLKIK